MRRAGLLLGGGGLVACAVAAGLLAAGAGGGGGRAVADDDAGTTTAPVERRTLVSRETASGTLGYADERSVRVRAEAGGDAAGSGGATVTAVAREGGLLTRGQVLYRLDGEAVRLLAGDTPAWRTMQQGDEGADIRALEHNLERLGYEPGTVDGTFDASTAAAVRAWQDDVGWGVTGRVQLGQVVFQPGTRRVGDVAVKPGDVVADGAEVLRTTSRRRRITVDLDAEQQTLAREGAAVRVTLPGGEEVAGRITRVGSVAQQAQGDDGDPSSGEPEATIPVWIALASRRGVGRLDGAPVSVAFASEISRRVLAVPVTALLALRGGGYAVEVAGPPGPRAVRVQPGQFADGYVAVRGEGLREGDEVVIPDDL